MWTNHSWAKRKAARKLARRHGPDCVYCGVGLTEPGDGGQTGPTTRTLDHLVPRSKGGPETLANLVLACSRCNNAKGDMMPLEFVAARVASTTA